MENLLITLNAMLLEKTTDNLRDDYLLSLCFLLTFKFGFSRNHNIILGNLYTSASVME